MTTITSKSGKKAVNIRNTQGSFTAAYVQIDFLNKTQQVLDFKTFATEKRALKWAEKKLA